MVHSGAARWYPVLVTFISFWVMFGVLSLAGVPFSLELVIVLAVLTLALGHVVWRVQRRSRKRST